MWQKKNAYLSQVVKTKKGTQHPKRKMKRHCEVFAWCICTMHSMQRGKLQWVRSLFTGKEWVKSSGGTSGPYLPGYSEETVRTFSQDSASICAAIWLKCTFPIIAGTHWEEIYLHGMFIVSNLIRLKNHWRVILSNLGAVYCIAKISNMLK